jgi:phospholipase D1/2
MRDASTVSALIEADEYFKAIVYALTLAASEIFIAGWWLNVDLPLLRYPDKHPTTLRSLLLDAASNRNVRIYVLLYKEQAIAMPNNSQFAEEILSNLHPNISALRHPHPLNVDATLWSHHEKLVIVDRR